MDLNVLEKDKTKLVLEIIGETHTLPNILREHLHKDKSVKAAAYRIKHPLVSYPELLVETTKGTPKKVLKDAGMSVIKTATDFRKAFTKAVK